MIGKPIQRGVLLSSHNVVVWRVCGAHAPVLFFESLQSRIRPQDKAARGSGFLVFGLKVWVDAAWGHAAYRGGSRRLGGMGVG